MMVIPKILICALFFCAAGSHADILPCESMPESATKPQSRKPDQNHCNPLLIDADSVVCVCDESYCDSLIVDETPPAGQYVLITSDREGKRFSTSTRYVESFPNYDPQDHCTEIISNKSVYFTTNRLDKGQTILGFGGAFTDAVGYNLNTVSDGLVDQIFDSYFSYSGLRYNLARTTIAHCDFSPTEYYYDYTDYDINLTDFKLAQDDYLYRIPYIKRAQSMVEEGLLLFSSLWTCPAWMRGNDDVGIQVKVLEKYYDSFCLYIMKYLEAYKKEGIEHYSVAFSNEPTISLGIIVAPTIEKVSLTWTLEGMIKFAEKHFIPALAAKFPETSMLFLDDNRLSLIGTWQVALKQHPEFTAQLKVLGMHSYLNGFISPMTLDTFHETNPEVTIVTTEFSVGTPGILGSWSYAEFYATTILEEINHHTSGWIDWNLVLNAESQPSFTNTPDSSPIIVDAVKNEFYKQPSYYALGHFSKWIPRGSTKIGLVSQFPTNIEHVCLQRPDGYLVAVLQNKSNDTVNVNIFNGGLTLKFPVTPHSISTVIF